MEVMCPMVKIRFQTACLAGFSQITMAKESTIMRATQKRKLQDGDDALVREYAVPQLLVTQQQNPRAVEKGESKESNRVFENEESLTTAIHELDQRSKRKLPRKEYKLQSLSLTESSAVKGERAVAALKMADGNMILLDEHTQFLHIDDMIKLGSLVPGCEPIIECPKSVVYKARDYIVDLKKEVDVLRGHLKNRSHAAVSHDPDSKESLPHISSLISAPNSCSDAANRPLKSFTIT